MAKTIKKAIKKSKATTKKNLLINFLLDETGSMSSCLQATISGFNEYVNGMKKSKDNISFTLSQFDNLRFNVVYNAEAIKNVRDLNTETYRPGSGTNLYDSISRSIKAAEINSKRFDNILCVIMTDGEENSSHEYTLDMVKKLIQEKEKAGWTFVYMGANQDAWKVGHSFGLSKNNTFTYDTNKTIGTFDNLVANSMSYCCTAVRGMSSNNFFVDNTTYEKSKTDNELLNKA